MAKDALISELGFLWALRARVGKKHNARSGAVALGIGDDCAILRPKTRHDVLVTTDFSLEGRHFRRDWHTGEAAGHRCLTRGLSDLAAMGGKPMAAFLSLAIPRSMAAGDGARWLRSFINGLLELADSVGVELAGGDTAAAPGDALLSDIVLLGLAPSGTALRRSGARAGDGLYVTGSLGGSAAELMELGSFGGKGYTYLRPQARLEVGKLLRRKKLASAAIDVSDGLSSDLAHLCEESGVDSVVEIGALPGHPRANGRLELMLHGGEDYELLFTARPGVKMPRSLAGVPVTRIGTMVQRRKKRGAEVTMVGLDGRRRVLKPGGWEHTF